MLHRLIILLCGLIPSSLQAQAPSIAFQHVTVIDMTGAPPKSDQTVIIQGQRIQSVGASQRVTIPDHVQIVNAKGKFLIPGLWDAHVHLSKAGVHSLPLFIAHGVTSVRDMGGDAERLLKWRKEIELDERLGPSIKTAGPMLESTANVERMKREGTIEPVHRTRVGIGQASDAPRIVDSIAALGVDFLKVRSVASLSTYQAIARAARQVKLPLTGHAVAFPEEIIAAGQKSIEHSFFPPLDRLSPDERETLFAQLAQQGIYLTPTLVNWERSLLIPYERAALIVEDSLGALDSRRKYLSGYLIKDWREQLAERKDYPMNLDTLYSQYLRDVRAMYQAGVRLLVGTDVAVLLIYPGFSLHEELEVLVQTIGMTPMQALISATRHPAEFFNLQDSLGTIESDKIADLVLLNANPLDDISNTQKIAAVVVRGQYYDRKKLDDLLTEVKVNRE